MKKINILLAPLLCLMLFCRCASVSYLPTLSNVGVSERGAHITVHRHKGSPVTGEFIAIDSARIIVLPYKTHHCEAVPVGEVSRFNIIFAQQRHREWIMPVYALFTALHGWYLVISAPVNLTATIIIAASDGASVRYSNHDITYEELNMFARFPQGLPPQLRLEDIR